MGPKGRRNLRKEFYRSGRHLFYSEGTKTEPYYVDSIKKCINPIYSESRGEMVLENCNLKSTLCTKNLVKYAFDDSLRRYKIGEQVNHVWIFFDKDDFSMSDYKAAISMIVKKNNSKKINTEGFHYDEKTNITYHALYSNEAFELFLLLYFNRVDNEMSRFDYEDKLNNFVKSKGIISDFDYKKNIENIHQVLTNAGGSLELAIKNAKSLKKKNGISNPSTNVYEFAEYFSQYFLYSE